MRVVTFNIQHGLAPSGRVELDALRHACDALAPELLALQEVDVGVRRSGRANLAAVAAGGRAVAFGPALSLARGLNGRYGNAIAVRGGITDVTTLRLPGERGDEPRAATLARALPECGPPVTVCATHLSVRAHVARAQLDACLAALTARPGPHLLAGDLNLLPADVEPAVAARGLVLADAAEPTFPVDGPRIRIDHVAVGPGLHVERVEVVPTAVSDHRALVVEVR